MRALCSVLLAAFAVAHRDEVDVLVSRGDTLDAWTFSPGVEFPGSNGSLTVDPAAGALRLAYDFSASVSKQNGYVIAIFGDAAALSSVASPSAMTVAVAAAPPVNLMVRVIDSTGQAHLGNVPHANGLVSANLAGLGTHWGGANDGVLHYPLAAVGIGVDKAGSSKVGSVLLANMSLVSATAPNVTVRRALSVGFPAGIAYSDELVQGNKAFVVNTTLTNVLKGGSRSFSLQFKSPSGASIAATGPGCSAPLAVEGWAEVTTQCALVLPPVSGGGSFIGYFPFLQSLELLYDGTDSSSTGSTSDSGHIHTSIGDTVPFESAIVVLNRSTAPLPAAGRVFGCQFLPGVEGSARLGIMHTRQQIYWQWMQRNSATEEPDWSSGEVDDSIKQASKRGMGVVVDLRSEPPDWALPVDSKGKRAPPYTLYPGPSHLKDYQSFAERVLKRYCEFIDGAEVGNEPDSLVYWVKPATSIAQAAQLYVGTMEAVQKAAAAVCPAVASQISALCVSGDDFWTEMGYNFTRAAIKLIAARPEGAPPLLAAVSSHPYARQHYVPTVAASWGSNASWTMPADEIDSPSILQAMRNLSSLVAPLTRAGDAKIMNRPSEFGYGLSIDEPAGGPWAREHAAAIAQSILLLRSDPTVDKFFLFSATFPGLESHTQYGLWRTGQPGGAGKGQGIYPLPAAAAFATAARFADQVGTKFSHALSFEDFHGPAAAQPAGLVFHNPVSAANGGGRETVLVLWTQGQFQGMDRNRAVASLPLELSALPQGTIVTAGTGEALHDATDGRVANVALEALPTYFTCARVDGEALEARVRAAVLAAIASR